MTRLRQTIAQRLKEAQNTAAMLTTFNEVDMSAIMKIRAEYKDIFEPGNYFLELQPNRLEKQEILNPILAQLAKDCGVPIVATNDCHYVDRTEAHAHEVLMCMGQGRTLDDPKRMKHDCDEFFIKRPDEMAPSFTQTRGAENGAASRGCEASSISGPERRISAFPPAPGRPRRTARVAHRGSRSAYRAAQSAVAILRRRYRARSTTARGHHPLPSRSIPPRPKFFRHAKTSGPACRRAWSDSVRARLVASSLSSGPRPIRYPAFERFLTRGVSMRTSLRLCMDRRDRCPLGEDRYGEDRVGPIATVHSSMRAGSSRRCRVWAGASRRARGRSHPRVPRSRCRRRSRAADL